MPRVRWGTKNLILHHWSMGQDLNLESYEFYIRLAAYLLGLAGIRDRRNAVGILENWCFENWEEIRCVTHVTELD